MLGRESPAITFLRAVPDAAGPFRTKTRQKVSCTPGRRMSPVLEEEKAVPHPSPAPLGFHLAAADPTAARGQHDGRDAIPRARGIPGQGDRIIQRVRQIPPTQKWLFSLCKGNGTQSQRNMPGGTGWSGPTTRLGVLHLPHCPPSRRALQGLVCWRDSGGFGFTSYYLLRK